MFENISNLGKLILLDDIDDLGKYSYEGHPSPIHHWMWGVLMITVAEFGDALLTWYNFMNNNDNNNNNNNGDNYDTGKE
ncbi:MAG: hypothetical protein QW046_04255 [Candidatus Micrarchaeaceae archaeon]